ncbi:MAG TPA: TRAP transporter large permease [Jiangellaceae bacterium]
MTLAIMGIAIVALLVIRVPIAFAILGPCLGYLWYTDQSLGLGLRLAAQGINSWPLLAVPLFILVGVVANRAGIADRLFEFALSLFGRVQGSLGYVNIGVSVGFSWMSGSALADAAGLGSVEVPAMRKQGYPAKFAAGITAASTVIGPIMPPSIPAIIYAAVAVVSTGALFAASVVPAFMLAISLAIAVFIWARSREELRTARFSWAELARTFFRAAGAMLTPVIIIGGILTGLFTPTEAAGVGACYMLVLGLAYRSVRLRDLPGIFRDTALTTASITIILGASALLGWILARERVPQAVAEAIFTVTDNKIVFLILVNLFLLLLGAIIEPTSALVLSVPILLPVAVEFGVDPVHFGVIAVLNLMIGLLTPPMGGVLYVLSSVTGISVADVFRGVAPFLIPLLLVLGVVTFVPGLVLWLPGLLGL